MADSLCQRPGMISSENQAFKFAINFDAGLPQSVNFCLPTHSRMRPSIGIITCMNPIKLAYCRIFVSLSAAIIVVAGVGTGLFAQPAKTTKIVLAGDSTVTDSSGWGAGFSSLLSDGAVCVNLAVGGRSSRSFRTEGWWQKCLDEKPDILLIQFGHNDQPGKGAARESAAETDFRDHLRRYVDEARQIGCKPVLITSLTRRRWDENGKITPTLSEYAAATIVVAKEKNVPLLDLHRLSIQQCNAIGPEDFQEFESKTDDGFDHTHLNDAGGLLVGKLVARELVKILPEFSRYVDRAELHNLPPKSAGAGGE
ncbi:Rhamnogalacturonan acetylesterase RhgT [Fuerstiella marisgermanici]|uniref:Rhamnogalacturonan acetylesterase RhgT n=2 Tax=Fuerstiella marisgermanici TaxID=1891926 RepID=A0A1P8WR99_9PLAN|nr:Rhamnogalacturonan acetylesterase RhgT [Fuerstiella marisgermanici]